MASSDRKEGKVAKATRSPTRTDARISGEVRRLDDLRAVEVRRIDELRHVERRADRRLSKVQVRRLEAQQEAEARRVDALLADAKSAVALDRVRADMTASTLAEKVADSAVVLQEKGEATAKAGAIALEAAVRGLTDRIGPLEQSRYEQGGAKVQQQETRVQSNWTTDKVIAIAAVAFAGAFALADLILRTFTP
jgi:hypothetical protein